MKILDLSLIAMKSFVEKFLSLKLKLKKNEPNKQNFLLISSSVFLDHKSLVVGIAVVIAFVFAVAGIFIGVYFRIERFLRCIDRIGGSNDTEAEALINDDTKV